MVNLLHCKRTFLEEQIKNKQFVCFGAGAQFGKFLKFWVSEDSIDNLLCVVDSNKAGQKIEYLNKSISICTMNQFINDNRCKDFNLIITNLYSCMEIVDNLDQYELFNDRNCFVYHMIDGEYPKQSFDFILNTNPKIDKVIHYCWFGKAEIPEHLQRCINSWKQYCPDYKLVRWDESNYDISKNKYMKDAYDAKKWGFVPDFARLDIIYNYGGFYLDTDVELIKSLDCLRGNEMYCGFENNHFIALGLGFGAVKGHRLIKKMMDMYNTLKFETRYGLPVVSPVYQTEALLGENVQMNNTFQQMDDFTVYPSEVMAPIGSLGIGSGITQKTVSIHHYEGSWVENRLELRKKREEVLKKYYKRTLVI